MGDWHFTGNNFHFNESLFYRDLSKQEFFSFYKPCGSTLYTIYDVHIPYLYINNDCCENIPYAILFSICQLVQNHLLNFKNWENNFFLLPPPSAPI